MRIQPNSRPILKTKWRSDSMWLRQWMEHTETLRSPQSSPQGPPRCDLACRFRFRFHFAEPFASERPLPIHRDVTAVVRTTSALAIPASSSATMDRERTMAIETRGLIKYPVTRYRYPTIFAASSERFSKIDKLARITYCTIYPFTHLQALRVGSRVAPFRGRG